MSAFVAWVLYPLVLLGLCGGVGLLVDAISGRRLPGVLVAPVGLAAIVVVGQFTTLTDATAGLTMLAVVALAVIGAALALPWRFGRPDHWPIAAALAVFAIYAAPVVLSGEPTLAGYGTVDSSATWLAITDHLMEHGRDLGALEPSTFRATLDATLGSGDPIGAFLPFGAAQKVVGGDLAWVFQPYLAFLAAMLCLCLWQLTGGILRDPRLRALAAFVAAQPALLFGFGLLSGIQELSAAVFIALAATLASNVARSNPGKRNAALLVLPAAALVGVLNLGGLIWLVPMLVALAVLVRRDAGGRGLAARAFAFALPLVLLSVPVLFNGSFDALHARLVGEGELSDLLNPVQVLGIWPSGDIGADPDAIVPSAMLIALGAIAALFGLWVARRDRATSQLLFASSLIAAVAIALLEPSWTSGEPWAIAAPAALSLAIVGAIAAAKFDSVTGAILVVAVAGGVLWSNILAYGGANLAPYDQLAELEEIGEDFAGQGPALMVEYNPYGTRHFLRDLDAEGAADLRIREVALRGEDSAEERVDVNLDEVDAEALIEYRTLVLRRSPVRSRPPLLYRLVRSGKYYEVWQRPVEPEGELILHHTPLGDDTHATAPPNCGEVGGLGLLALSNQLGLPPEYIRIVGMPHAPIYNATDGALSVPKAGEYTAWLKGSVRGEVELLVDGRRAGDARHRLNGDAGFVELGSVQLSRGAHRVELRFGGADLHPGSGGFPRPETGPLLFAPPATETGGEVVTVTVDKTDPLCGKSWDWIEAIGYSE